MINAGLINRLVKMGFDIMPVHLQGPHPGPRFSRHDDHIFGTQNHQGSQQYHQQFRPGNPEHFSIIQAVKQGRGQIPFRKGRNNDHNEFSLVLTAAGQLNAGPQGCP